MYCEISGTGVYLAPENDDEAAALKALYDRVFNAKEFPKMTRIPMTSSKVAGKSIEADFRCDAWCHRLRPSEKQGFELFISLEKDMAENK